MVCLVEHEHVAELAALAVSPASMPRVPGLRVGHRCLLVFVEHRLWDGLAALEAVIVFSNLAKHTGWIAHDDDVCGNVLRHHRAGTDNRVVADSHAGQDDGTCAEPYVLADVNLLKYLCCYSVISP